MNILDIHTSAYIIPHYLTPLAPLPLPHPTSTTTTPTTTDILIQSQLQSLVLLPLTIPVPRGMCTSPTSTTLIHHPHPPTPLTPLTPLTKLIYEAYVDKGDVFSNRPLHIHTVNQDRGILFEHGDAWRKIRNFTMRTLKDLGLGKNSLEVAIQVCQHPVIVRFIVYPKYRKIQIYGSK